MRRVPIALAVLAVAAGLGATARAAGNVELTVGRATFPDRTLVLTLPHSAALTAAALRVTENGRPVDGLAVAGRDTQEIGFVLAIDESASMRGRPLDEALRAARAFAAKRWPAQRLGVVAFNAHTSVLLAPTTDGHEIDSTLSASARVAVGTRLWDAVAESIQLLRSAGVPAGSVVVLSDGRDTRSTLTAQDVVRRANAAGVRLFTIGLRSPQFEPSVLRMVARETGGTYAETNSKGLMAVYAALAQRLANEYVVRYRSTAPRGSTVSVAVVVPAFGRDAGTAAVTYTAPLPPGGGVLHHSAFNRFVRSSASVAAIAVAVAALVATAIALALRAVRGRSLVRRIGAYVGVRDAAPAVADGPGLVQRSLGHLHSWDAFQRDLEIGRVNLGTVRLAALALAGAALALVVAAVAGIVWIAAFAIVPFVAVRVYAARKARKVCEAFEEQLPDTLRVLASALRAGHGMSSAIRVAIEDAKEPTRSELEHALAEEQLGVPLDEAFMVVADRMRSPDFEHIAFVTGVHRQTGGNTAEVLDRVHDVIRERFELRRMVHTLTAQARMTRWILTLLPLALALVIAALNPEYMRPLFDTTVGRVLIAVSLSMVVAGSFLIKRLTEIKV